MELAQETGVNWPEPRDPLLCMGPATRSGWYRAWRPASHRALCFPRLMG